MGDKRKDGNKFKKRDGDWIFGSPHRERTSHLFALIHCFFLGLSSSFFSYSLALLHTEYILSNPNRTDLISLSILYRQALLDHKSYYNI